MIAAKAVGRQAEKKARRPRPADWLAAGISHCDYTGARFCSVQPAGRPDDDRGRHCSAQLGRYGHPMHTHNMITTHESLRGGGGWQERVRAAAAGQNGEASFLLRKFSQERVGQDGIKWIVRGRTDGPFRNEKPDAFLEEEEREKTRRVASLLAAFLFPLSLPNSLHASLARRSRLSTTGGRHRRRRQDDILSGFADIATTFPPSPSSERSGAEHVPSTHSCSSYRCV